MKKTVRKILSFVVMVCVAFMGVFTMPMVSAKAATSYEETAFGAGTFLITTVDSAGTKYYLPTDAATSKGPVKTSFTDVSSISTDHLWTVEATATEGEYTIKNSNNQYLYTTSSNGGVRVATQTTPKAWKYDSATNSLQYTDTSRYLGVYVDGSDWRSYTSATHANYKESGTAFVFYKVDDSAPSINVESETEFTYTQIDETLQLTATLNNVSGEVAWKSSNENVATVDSNGAVKGVAMGETTISASVGEVTGSLGIKVYPIKNSEISIVEALTVCELTGQTNAPYNYSITGVIASIDDVYSSEYNNITVTITDGTDRIKAFRMAEGSDLQVGDEIKVTGTLVNFEGNTPEFIQGCTYEKKVDNNWEAIKAQLDAVEAYMKLGYKYTQTTTEEEISATTEVTFNLGADGEAGHSDTTASKDTYSETAEGYTLELTSGEKMYPGSKDALGNGCIKFGTSSVVGGFSFTVPEEVTKVVIEVAGYKANNAKVTVNTTSYDIDTCSNDGAYTKIEVDTSSTKTVTFETQSTPDERAMLNTITWVVASGAEEGATEEVVTFSNSEFRILCGVNASLLEIENLEVGIQVTAGDKTVNYTTTAESWTVDGDKAYIIINLGDIVNDKAKLETTFTVKAYVIYEDIVRTSKNAAEYSVIGMLNKYTADGVESVAPLVEYLTDKGLM